MFTVCFIKFMLLSLKNFSRVAPFADMICLDAGTQQNKSSTRGVSVSTSNSVRLGFVIISFIFPDPVQIKLFPPRLSSHSSQTWVRLLNRESRFSQNFIIHDVEQQHPYE